MNAIVSRRLFRPQPSWVRDFGDVSREIDSLFNGVFGNREPRETPSDWTPHVESYRKDDTLHVRADLPGVDPKAVEISVEDDVLTVRGERKAEHEDATYREIHYGSFERRLRLPENTDPEKVTATYTNGVLEIAIPITKPVARKVSVNVATA